jgi:hypothetical protein
MIRRCGLAWASIARSASLVPGHGITVYVKNGGTLENVVAMVNHALTARRSFMIGEVTRCRSVRSNRWSFETAT